jgi:hypothetical protein
MARRAFARIGTDIHDEPSYRDLTAEHQWAYELVLKRPDLSRCGVVAYTPRRWAKVAKGMTEKRLKSLYTGLSETRHVVLDEDTQELLARTYVRHDGLLAQPNVVAAMVSDYQLIDSDTVRVAFLAELRRIWDLDIEANVRGGWLLAMGVYPPANDDSKIRFPEGMRPAALEALKRAIGTGLSVDMAQAIAQRSVRPFDDASEKASPEGFTEGSRGRADAAPSPAPTPSPAPVAAATPADAGGGAPRRSSHHERHLLDIHQAELGPLQPIHLVALAKHLAAALDTSTDEQLLTALTEWRRRPDAKPGLLPHLIADATRTSPDPTTPSPDALAWVAEQKAARAAAAGATR